jgi:hypothetical protein
MIVMDRGRSFAIQFQRAGFRALIAFDRGEADALARLHIDETGATQNRSVQEHVFPARIRRDEAEALGGVEPLYRAFAAFAGRTTAIGTEAAAEAPAITAAEAAAITTAETTTVAAAEAATITAAEAAAITATETTTVAAEAATTITIAITAETTGPRRTRCAGGLALRIFNGRGVIDFQHARYLTALLAGSDFTGNRRPFFQLLQPGALNHRHVNEHVF